MRIVKWMVAGFDVTKWVLVDGCGVECREVGGRGWLTGDSGVAWGEEFF